MEFQWERDSGILITTARDILQTSGYNQWNNNSPLKKNPETDTVSNKTWKVSKKEKWPLNFLKHKGHFMQQRTAKDARPWEVRDDSD